MRQARNQSKYMDIKNIFLLLLIVFLNLKPVNVLADSIQIAIENIQQTPPQEASWSKELSIESPILYLNFLRQALGMTPFLYNNQLQETATNHNDYLQANQEFSHYQKPNGNLFTGKTPSDRAHYVGYSSNIVEGFTYGEKNAMKSLDLLMSAIYHRFGLLDIQNNEIGFSWKAVKNFAADSIFIHNNGNIDINFICSQENTTPINQNYSYYKPCKDKSKRIEKQLYLENFYKTQNQNPKIIVWPPANSIEVTPVFYEEIPDPLPALSFSGYPASIQFNCQDMKIEYLTMKMYDQNNQKIESVFMDKNSDPNSKFNACQFALFPIRRLDYNTDYTVVAEFLIEEKKYQLDWSFKTLSLANKKVYTIKESQDLEVQNGDDFYLFFRTHNPKKAISRTAVNFKFTQGGFQKIKRKFVDQHTLHMVLPNGIKGNVEISLNDGTFVYLTVE